MRKLVTLVLGGGRGTRLLPLTRYRSKPAVPLAGKYRLIDIPLSNCINSGIKRIYVLTQFMSVSLHRHIRQTYRFDAFGGGFVELLAAQQTMEGGTDWYEGTADAVRKNLRYIEQSDIEHVLILSGDQLYRMDFRAMLKRHIESENDATIATIPVDRQDASALGIMRVAEDGRVLGFVEKPKTEEALKPVLMDPAWIDARGIQSNNRECLASMGIYLFNRDVLVKALRESEHQDFGREIFPSLLDPCRVGVHLFDGYWEDIGTIDAFFKANLQLASGEPPFDLVSPEAPIYSRARFLPPTQLEGATVRSSLIADGCQIGQGASIENSVIGLRCRIGANVSIKNSILMGADDYETRSEMREANRQDRPPIAIGEDSVIENAIVDKNVRIGRGARVAVPDGLDPFAEPFREAEHCAIRDGVILVKKDAALPDGWRWDG